MNPVIRSVPSNFPRAVKFPVGELLPLHGAQIRVHVEEYQRNRWRLPSSQSAVTKDYRMGHVRVPLRVDMPLPEGPNSTIGSPATIDKSTAAGLRLSVIRMGR
jgi:hypothetical protein